MQRSKAGGLILFLGLVTFLTAIGNTGLVSIMPAIGRLIGMADYLVASIFSLSALTWAVSSPFWTKHVAARGCNPFVRAGLVGFGFSMAGCSAAVALGLAGLVGPLVCFLAFFVLRAVFGFLGSASAIATQTLVARNTKGPGRTRALTGLAGALSFGTIVGPAAAPFLVVEPFGHVGPMLAFMALGLMALAGSYLFLPREPSVHAAANDSAPAAAYSATLRSIWRQPAIARPLNYGFLLCCAQAINIYTIGFILIDRRGEGPAAAQALIGFTMTAAAVAALAGQWGLPRLLSISPRSMSVAGGMLALAGNALPAFDASVLSAAAGFIVASLGYGIGRPGFSAEASLAGDDCEQVAIATAVTLIAGASITLPPVVAAAAYEHWLPAPFVLAGLTLIASLQFVFDGAARRPIVHPEQ